MATASVRLSATAGPLGSGAEGGEGTGERGWAPAADAAATDAATDAARARTNRRPSERLFRTEGLNRIDPRRRDRGIQAKQHADHAGAERADGHQVIGDRE